MKNKVSQISQLSAAALGLACICMAGTAYGSIMETPTGMDQSQRGTNRADKPSGNSSPAAKGVKSGRLSSKDKTFMMNAAKGGMMEVTWGKWAAQKAQNADVKKFGNRMVTDHSKANSELMGLAKEEGVTLPSDKTSGKWKSDKDYMDMMVKDHEKDLAEFQNEAKEGTDPDLKKFAEKTSKVIQKHLKMSKEIQGKLK